jgi:predicted TIM-barrel fold metal-dependent hydrolase
MQRRTVLAGAAASLAACATPAEQVPADHAAPPMFPFVDAHVHLNDEAMQLALMERFHVERAVVFWGRASSNASIADAVRRHPRRFIAFASISPERAAYRSAWPKSADPAPLLAELDALLASGQFHGIGETSAVHFPSPGFPEADFDLGGPMVAGIFALARKHRVPPMLHVEWTRLDAFERLLEAHRDVTVIWAHGGYTPLYVAQRLLARHPNLVYELSARTWPQHPRSPDYTILRDGRSVWPEWLALIEREAQRFIVGTDASHRSLALDAVKHESVQNLLRQLGAAAREAVGRSNLLRLLQLA